jgi:hypothetical protein
MQMARELRDLLGHITLAIHRTCSVLLCGAFGCLYHMYHHVFEMLARLKQHRLNHESFVGKLVSQSRA